MGQSIETEITAQLREARAALNRERERTVAEREAFARFIHRVDAIEDDSPQGTSAAVSSPIQRTGLSESATTSGTRQLRGLGQVRDAYHETIMAVPHYEAEYDESLRENMAAEFGTDVVTAVCETAHLTPPIRHALLRKGHEAYHERRQLLETLDDEDEQLDTARERLTDLTETCERIEREIATQPSTWLSFPDSYEAWHRLRDLEAECDRLLAERQRFIQETGTAGTLDATAFYGYLYKSLAVTYPVLAVGTHLCDRLHKVKRWAARELTRHA